MAFTKLLPIYFYNTNKTNKIMKKLPKTTVYTPREIAENLYLQNSYTDLIRAVKGNTPAKDVKFVREDLQAMFCYFTRDEMINFDNDVKEELGVIEKKTQIRALRNQISNKQIRLQQLINESKQQ